MIETWLNDSILDSMVLSSNDYSIYRKDRSTACSGGGICVCLSKAKALYYSEVHLPSKFNCLEVLALTYVCMTRQMV